jgi:hypothetical protein
MINKIGAVARIVATVLAIVAAFVAIPSLNVTLVLVVLGLIAGLAYSGEEVVRLFLVVLVLPAVGVALGTIPAIGEQLSALASNIALAAAGIAATVIARRLIDNSKGDVAGLSGK